MEWKRLVYVTACVVVPVAWGMLVWWSGARIEAFVKKQGRRRGLPEEEAEMPPLDYHI